MAVKEQANLFLLHLHDREKLAFLQAITMGQQEPDTNEIEMRVFIVLIRYLK